LTGIFLDTNLFVAFANRKDRDHARAVQLFERVRKGEFGQPYTSDYIFDEALTVTLVRTGKVANAIKIGKLILGAKEEAIPVLAKVLRVDEHLFSESWRNFERGKLRDLSFTDQTILSLMKEHSLDYLLSFDKGFDGLVARIG
jgi:predicted nucleic acid-binding protein